MGWHRPPSLLIAVHRLERGAQEFSQLLLGLAQLFSGLKEFLSVHSLLQKSPREGEETIGMKYYNVVLVSI